ncbi:hypothetical protein EI555_005581 [Monodon monoceros]|uniref:Uncharacterized protein n=1 Tax=Monodon monoceros TaxID=40151 RepID=A0A4U1F8T5_MONMO|nr:hypothetical protein EI555_005581 [Monodon monoceros]
MYPNPLVYCTCWDPWNLGPRKLIETPQPPRKTSPVKSKPARYLIFHIEAQEIINVSPGYCFVRNREQICVTLGDEMSARKKHSESENMDKVRTSRQCPWTHILFLSPTLAWPRGRTPYLTPSPRCPFTPKHGAGSSPHPPLYSEPV